MGTKDPLPSLKLTVQALVPIRGPVRIRRDKAMGMVVNQQGKVNRMLGKENQSLEGEQGDQTCM